MAYFDPAIVSLYGVFLRCPLTCRALLAFVFFYLKFLFGPINYMYDVYYSRCFKFHTLTQFRFVNNLKLPFNWIPLGLRCSQIFTSQNG